MTVSASGGRSRNLILAAMIFAVAMTFIDQTIVSIAVPNIQRELGLTSTGVQWMVNAYLLSLSALFGFGGRLADTIGHTKMVTLGVIVFAGASALCGATPKGAAAEAWIVIFRVLQGVGGAIMFPAALAIVVQTFELRQRGKALALFFGIAGGLTAIGPVLGGYLTQWTWRAIFWVNVPVALIALALIAISRPVTDHQPARIDYRGLVLVAAGVALSVFGFQQSNVWGWHNPLIWLSIAVGLALLVVFYFVEVRTEQPLMKVSIFRIRPFLVENLVLGITNLVFIPVFFFGSEYAQISLGKSSSQAGVILLYFFIGFVIAAQIGGRMLDRIGAKRPVVIGCVLGAVGFFLWAGNVTSLSFSAQQWFIVLAGAGMGFMLGPASTDAVNRASRLSYGEATGITQTVRNYAASMGLAILGTVLVTDMRNHLTSSLTAQGLPPGRAAAEAATLSQAHGSGSGSVASIPHFFRLDFAQSTQTVLYVMGAIMAAGLSWPSSVCGPAFSQICPAAPPTPTAKPRPSATATPNPTTVRAGLVMAGSSCGIPLGVRVRRFIAMRASLQPQRADRVHSGCLLRQVEVQPGGHVVGGGDSAAEHSVNVGGDVCGIGATGTVLCGEAQDGGRWAFVPVGQLGEGHLACRGVLDHRGSCLDC